MNGHDQECRCIPVTERETFRNPANVTETFASFYVRERNVYKTCVRIRSFASAGFATGAVASPICVTMRS